MLAFTRLSFFTGPYINSRAARKEMKSPVVMSPLAMRSEPYHSTPTTPNAPSHSMSDGSAARVLVTFIVIR